MALTKVSPSVIQTANSVIVSNTFGNATSVASFTFDASGVITGASNVAIAIANTQVTGRMTSAQISNTAVTTGTKYGVNCTGTGTTQGIMYMGPTTVATGLQTGITSGTNINNTGSGTFNVIIRRGDDKTSNKIVSKS